MGFKANIDIALSLSFLKICSIRQQGLIRFRVYLYHISNNNSEKNIQTVICHPYSIIRHKSQNIIVPTKNHQLSSPLKNNRNPVQQNSQSEIDSQSEFYLSKPFRIMLEQESHPVLETCCFKTYVDIQKYSDLNLKCQVQLLFCPNTVSHKNGEYKTIGRCYSKVRKLFDVSTYLPVVFDQFQGVVIQGVYNAALMDFNFEKETENNLMSVGHSIENTPESFYEYLNSITGGFNRQQTRNFYHYYRQLLEKQLFTIQQRHYDLLRTLSCPNEDFRLLRINPNVSIDNMIDTLSGYNSNVNDKLYYNQYRPSNTRRSHQYNSSTSEQYVQETVSSASSDKHLQKIYSKNIKDVFYQSPKKDVAMRKMQIADQITRDYKSIKALIFQKWFQFIDFSHNNISMLAEKYKLQYDKLVKERLSANVFSHQVSSNEWKRSVYEDSGRDHLKQAEVEKKKIEKDEELWKEAFVIENEHFFPKERQSIKIFQEIYPVAIENKISNKRFSLRQINDFTQTDKEDLYPEKGSLHEYYHHLPPKNSHQHKLPRHNTVHQVPGMIARNNSLQMNYLHPAEFLETLDQKRERQDHFVILVHGYQATRQDFMVFKNCLEIRFSHIKVFISTCNQGRTEDSIETLGGRLAVEIQKLLNSQSPTYNYKLSFIGHSMGGLIIRTALCYLQNIDRNLFSFITLSSPHLGYLYEPSTHIQAGLWMMKTLQKSLSIEQVCMRDKQEMRDCFLYKLSRSGSLNKFKNLAFVGSVQDKYVPYESARIQQNQTLISQKLTIPTGQIIYEMIDGMLGRINCKKISRMNVIFNIQESNFDTMIGRTAHIKYLSDRQFIKTFCIVFDKFFK